MLALLLLLPLLLLLLLSLLVSEWLAAAFASPLLLLMLLLLLVMVLAPWLPLLLLSPQGLSPSVFPGRERPLLRWRGTGHGKAYAPCKPEMVDSAEHPPSKVLPQARRFCVYAWDGICGDQRTGRTPDGKKELWRPNMSAVKAFISNVRATGKSNT